MEMVKTKTLSEEATLPLEDATSSGGGMVINFKDLRFSVPLKQGGAWGHGTDRFHILKGISGSCVPGNMMAIMGSSGAGKTTLLDILACNPMPSGRVEGTVTVNGAPRRATAFRRASCYVLQRDVLLSSATVRESITTSALLKLPMTLSKKEKMDRVDRVLRVLGLVDCQHTLVGDELLGIKGISGGQRRRVSIGIELVKDPRVIMLDEPTSGLDSEAAVSVVDTLRTLARTGRTVVLTIHQPNSLITSMFDDYMLLADGKSVYYGPWSGAVDAFAAVGLQCPQYTNPTDFFLNVLQDPAAVDALVERQNHLQLSGNDVEAAADASTAAAAASPSVSLMNGDGEIATATAPGEDGFVVQAGTGTETKGGRRAGTAGSDSSAPPAPAWYQTWVLANRNLRQYWRNPVMLFSETAQYVFMGLFVGLMYLQLSNSVETGVSDRLASIWFAMAVLSFTPSYTAVTVWDRERVLLRREVGQSMYSVQSWFLAKAMVNIPIQTIQVLLFGLIAFFMVGYAITVSNILIYLASFALFQITSESVGVLCAALTKTSTTAVLALTFVLLILLSFSGFLVSAVPVYFKWVRYISYLTYALTAAVDSEFSATEFVCVNGPPGCPTAGMVIPGQDLIPPNMQNGLSPGYNLLILLGICVGTRVLCFFAIYGAYRINFL